jgi:hypothetical protein
MTDRPPVSGEPIWCRGNCLTQHAHRYGPPVSGESSYEARLSEAILNGTDSDTGDLWIHRDDVHLIDDAIHEARATPPSLDGERLIAHLNLIKRSPRKTNAEWQAEDISFDVGVAAAQDAIRSFFRLTSKEER